MGRGKVVEKQKTKLGARILSKEELNAILPNAESIYEQIGVFRDSIPVNNHGQSIKTYEIEQKTNNIGIMGCRGAGKTSILKTFFHKLCTENEKDIILPIIIPENMSSGTTLMDVILGRLKSIVEEQKRTEEDEKYSQDCIYSGRNLLEQKYNELVKQYCYIKKDYRDILIQQFTTEQNYVDKTKEVFSSDAEFLRLFNEFMISLLIGSRNLRTGEVLFFILAAAITRIWIALALQDNYWRNASLDELVRRFADGTGLKEFYKKHWGGMEEKEAKENVLSYCQEQWDMVLQILPEQPEGRTIIQEIFHVPAALHTSDETIFLFYGMKYLGEYKKRGGCYETDNERQVVQCLLQYLRVKNYVFGCTVQKKGVRGLDYFQKEYYEKDAKLNKFYASVLASLYDKKDKIAYWEQAMRKQFHNRDLKKIEFRSSIDDNEALFRKNIRDFLEAYRNVLREDYCNKKSDGYKVCRPFPRVGLVFHLLKQEDNTVPYKCFLDGIEEKEKLHFGVLEEKYVEQVRIMRRLRNQISGLDNYLVGLDAASLENATPVWVFTRAYEEARDSAIEKIGYGENRIQSLRFTFHAGEDFRHILSGLRRVDEAVTYLKFHAGDRIGHGTSLGISPEQWQRSNPFVVLPRREALDNYVWAYHVLSQDVVECSSTLLAYLERKVYEIAKGIYGKGHNISLQVLVEGYLRLFDTKSGSFEACIKAENIGFCREVRNDLCSEILWNGEKIALARHCKKFLTEMECPIHYEVTNQDIQITEVLQRILRQKLSREGIVVEVNPSSNVAIGEVDKITENQIYKLNTPDGENNVMACINSDDPMVFHTNISNELAYIYYGMLYNGVSRETALGWIDRIRECGMKASFLQGEDSDQQIYDKLEGIVELL